MSKRNRNKGANGFFGGTFWQSSEFNQRCYSKNLEWIFSLAMNRFKWEGLPETCNARFLEQTLLENGKATIARDGEIWRSFRVVHGGDFTVYGESANWRAMGYNGVDQFECDWNNGAIIYDNRSWTNPWNTITLLARRLTHYERTEDVNLAQQQVPMVYTAPKEKRLELINTLKQAQGGEPAVIANENFKNYIKVEALNVRPEFIGQDLAIAKENVNREIYRFLGIEHLAFEKGERLIESEAKANSAPTTIKRLDALQARREACEYLNNNFGLNIWVYFNDDIDSYNWAYLQDAEKQALLNDGAASISDDGEVNYNE